MDFTSTDRQQDFALKRSSLNSNLLSANVTEEEILYHVAEAQCCLTLEDIKRHTGANTGCECLTKNPAGG